MSRIIGLLASLEETSIQSSFPSCFPICKCLKGGGTNLRNWWAWYWILNSVLKPAFPYEKLFQRLWYIAVGNIPKENKQTSKQTHWSSLTAPFSSLSPVGSFLCEMLVALYEGLGEKRQLQPLRGLLLLLITLSHIGCSHKHYWRIVCNLALFPCISSQFSRKFDFPIV